MQDQSNISFNGNPFQLAEAEEQFRKLKESGTNSIKMTISWEAIEHEVEGIYDEAYLAHLRKILIIAEKEGISVFIEPQELKNETDKERYITAFKHAQRRLKNCKAITGWGSIN